jgi:protein-tyrosine phosphatase
MSARPRGGDWLNDELQLWRQSGIDTIVSLLTPPEEQDLDLVEERRLALANDMGFMSFPSADRQVPNSASELSAILDHIDRDLHAGRNVLLHCRQGIGRTGLVAASLLARHGIDPESAITQLSKSRSLQIPETPTQRHWIRTKSRLNVLRS